MRMIPISRLARRLAFTAVFAGCLIGAAVAQRIGWDGGWEGDAGVQLTFAGDKLISFYWLDDYKEIVRLGPTPDGAGKSFAWAAGSATLTRETGGGALLVVRERGGKEVPVRLKRE